MYFECWENLNIGKILLKNLVIKVQVYYQNKQYVEVVDFIIVVIKGYEEEGMILDEGWLIL